MSKKDLSKKNPLAISHERRLELEHFCKQYWGWYKDLCEPIGLKSIIWYEDRYGVKLDHSNPTEAMALHREWLTGRMLLIDECVNDTIDICYGKAAASRGYGQVSSALHDAVTKGLGYSKLGIEDYISEYQYQKMYRYFFYILDKRRD